MTSHKDQHEIPRSYLAAWTAPDTPPGHEPSVWVHAKDGTSRKRRAPKNTFTHADLYTLRSGGERDLSVEIDLGRVEAAFASRIRPRLETTEQLESADLRRLLEFIAAMMTRPARQMENLRGFFREALERSDEMAHKFSGHNNVRPDLERLIQDGPQQGVAIAMQDALRILGHMSMAVLCTDDAGGFITSDNPCVMFNPETADLPDFLQSPGTAQRDTELTLPVSPRRAILMTNKPLVGYHSVPTKIVNEINYRTRTSAAASFVSRTPEVRQEWFHTSSPRPPERRQFPVGSERKSWTWAGGQPGPTIVVCDPLAPLPPDLDAMLTADWGREGWEHTGDLRECGPGSGPKRLQVMLRLERCPSLSATYAWDGAAGPTTAVVVVFLPEIPASLVAELRSLSALHPTAQVWLTPGNTVIEGPRPFAVGAIGLLTDRLGLGEASSGSAQAGTT